MNPIRRATLVASALATALAAFGVQAQATFPNKPVKLVVGVAPRGPRHRVGGAVHRPAAPAGRPAARRLHEALGAIVAALEARELPDRLPPPDVSTVDNPFA